MVKYSIFPHDRKRKRILACTVRDGRAGETAHNTLRPAGLRDRGLH